MEEYIIPIKKSFALTLAETCLKAAAATVGVMGAFAAISELGKLLDGTKDTPTTEE